MGEELYKWMDKYLETFGEGFPTFQLMRSRTEQDGIDLIKHCLDVGKDVYQLGLVNVDDEY